MFKTLIPTFSVLISIIVFLFVTKPMYAEVADIQSERKNYEEVTNQYKDFNAKVDALLSKKNAVSIEDREKLDQMIPETIDIPRLFVDIEHMVMSHNMQLKGITAGSSGEVFQDKSVDDGAVSEDGSVGNAPVVLKSQELSFNVVGSYDDFKNMLQSLESNLLFMEITSLNINSTDGPFQDFAITIEVYMLSANK